VFSDARSTVDLGTDWFIRNFCNVTQTRLPYGGYWFGIGKAGELLFRNCLWFLLTAGSKYIMFTTQAAIATAATCQYLFQSSLTAFPGN
jgi:hypothetical protein